MSQNKPKKTRLDLAVFERGHTESREKAKALIMAGAVYVNGQKQLKAGIVASSVAKEFLQKFQDSGVGDVICTIAKETK